MKNRSYLLRLGAIRLPIKTLPKSVLYKEPELREFYAVGEKFHYEGENYIVVEGSDCQECDCCTAPSNCQATLRPDGKAVIFKNLN